MIIYNNGSNNDMKFCERFVYSLKLKLFKIVQKTQQANIISHTVFKCLIVLETLQLTFFVINPKYEFLWKSPILDVIQNLLQYVQVSTYLDQASTINFLLLLYLSFGLVLFSTGLNFYCLSTNQYKSVELKILSVYNIFLVTILQMPMMNSFLSAMICDPENNFIHGLECFSGVTIIHMISGIIGFILLMIQIVIANQLYLDLDPFSEFPIATLPTNIPWIKFILKLILPLYSLINRELAETKFLNIVLFIVFSIIIILRIRIPAFYKRDVLNTQVLCEGMLLWVTVCACIQAYIQKTGEETDIMSITYFLIGIPLFNFAMIKSLLTQRENSVLETDPNDFYKPDQIRVFINILIKQIEESLFDKKIKLKIMGILKIHQLKCISVLCPCNNMSPAQMRKDGVIENRRQWYLILKYIIYMYLEKNPKCTDLLLLSSYIHFNRLNLKYKALKELMKLEELKPDFQIAFCMFNQKYCIEDDIILNDGRQNKNNKGNMDVNSIVLFQNQFVIFKDAIESSQEQHCDFWTELQEPRVDVQKINTLGEQIQNSVTISKTQYLKLMKLNNDNNMSMVIYANYMRQIVNNEEEAEKLLDKLSYLDKVKVNQLKSQNNSTSGNTQTQKKSDENKNTCVITISTNLRQFCIIKNSNYDLMRMFAYKRQEVVENNVRVLMPKAIADQHDDVVQNYIENSYKTNLGRSRIVLAQNKDGFAVPCNLIVKVLPNLNQGMELVGFLNEVKPYFCPPYVNEDYSERFTQHYIVYDKKSLTITSCTQSCYSYFGIPVGLINGNSSAANNFTIDLICPEINDEETQLQLQQEGKVQLEFDTTIIGLQFLLSDDSKVDKKDKNEQQEIDGEINIFQNNQDKINVTDLDKSQLQNLKSQLDTSQVQEDNNNKNNKKSEQNQTYKQNIANNLVNPNIDNSVDKSNMFGSPEALYQDDYEDYNINQQFEDYLKVQYKKTQIMVYLEDDVLGQAVLRFEDLNEPERLDVNDEDNYGQSQDLFQKSVQEQEMQSKRLQEGDNIEEEEDHMLQENNHEYMQQIENEQKSHTQQSKSKNKSSKKGTSTAGQSSLNQKSVEQRYIKDLQLAFSDKTQSFTVQILKRVTFLLIFILISILSYQFVQKLSLRDNLTNSIQAIYIANNRHTVMPDSNYFARQIYLDANDYYDYDNENDKQLHKEDVQQMLQEKVKQLHEIQFQVLDQIEIIKQFYSKPIEQSSFKLKFQMPNGNIFEDDYSVTDGMLLMVAAASSISEADLDALIDSYIQVTYNTDQRYFFYISQNGMTDLRYGSEIFSVELQKIYNEYVNDFKGPNLVMMLLNLLITVTFGIVMVPLIFRVEDQNNELLSIFAIIPIEEIKYFIDQCNSFKQSYLIERTIEQIEKDKKEDLRKIQEQQQIQEDKINKSLQNLAKETNNNQLNVTNNANNTTGVGIYSINGSPDQKITEGPLLTKNMDQINLDEEIEKNNFKNTQSQQKEKAKQQQQHHNDSNLNKIEEQNNQLEEEEDGESRTDKLINSNKNFKLNIFIKFLVLTFIFIVYFITDNILETQFLEDVLQCIEHTQLMSARPSHIKYTLLFAMEEIVNGEQTWYDGNEMLYQYSTKIYENETNVEKSYQADFPGTFSSYKELFDLYNYADICEHNMWTKLSQESTARKGDKGYDFNEKCGTLQGGVLNKGLGQSIKTIYENIRTFITEWREVTKLGITKDKKKQFLNSITFQELAELQDFLLPMLYFLLDNFRDMYQDYIVYSITVQQITFSIIVLIISVCFLFIWVPYITKMGKITQRIKGMLNMLPVSLILKNKNLKNAFRSDGILKYFK